MKLMIVDDHAGVRALIRQIADLPLAAVCECASGEAALAALSDFTPDVVTMDVHLPGLSGFDATRAIRASHPTTRVVVVSAYDEPATREAALGAGADEFIAKDNLQELQPSLARFRAVRRGKE